MCDERELLIEYVYGEAVPDVRQRIDTHIGECHVCRAEVSALRGVRDDLLAWDVPRHEPIWRPFNPPPEARSHPSWSTWALAAAAGAVFTAGLAGGMAARGWFPASGAAGVVQVTSATPDTATPLQSVSTVTADDLAQLEAAILERVRNEMADRLRVTTSAPADVPASLARVSATGGNDETEERLAAIEQWMDNQISLNAAFNGNFGRLNSRTNSLSEQLELSRFQNVALGATGQ